MNIEGTPNEKALLVVFSYIIGFISAFIAFNFAVPVMDTVDVYHAKSSSQSASVVSSQEEQVQSNSTVVYEDNGLYLYTETQDEPTLLSKNIQSVGMDYTELPTLYDKQGLHTEVPVHTHFTVQGYIYYCEVYDVASECTPYIYDVDRKTLHVLTDSDGPLSVAVSTAQDFSMTSASGIEMGNYRSISLSQPWNVEIQ